MGEGKTEAAAYGGMQWITKCRLAGMYIALPTAATSNHRNPRVCGGEPYGQHWKEVVHMIHSKRQVALQDEA